MQTLLDKNISIHDTQESFFHGFVLGLLVHLNATHFVQSNRESGRGRCDVLITPKDKSKAGVVIEFKVANKLRKEKIEAALESAMGQIETRDYATQLQTQGIQSVRLVALAFANKTVRAQVKVLDLLR